MNFLHITCYVSDQGKSASFLSEFKTPLRWLQELGIWEGSLTTITEFSLGQTLFLMLEAFLFRRVKIDIDILMMARTLVKQVRKSSCWCFFSYRGENFTPVRNLATVSCKRETSTRVGRLVCKWTGKGSACVMFAILNHTCILST